MSEYLRIWSWRTEVAKAFIQPNTKLVLYTIANFMNEFGKGAFPSLDTLQSQSGLARATLCKHIKLAVEAGFLIKTTHGFSGKKWKQNEYEACYPGTMQGSSTTELPFPEGSSTDNEKAVQPLNSNTSLNPPIKKNNIKKKVGNVSLQEWEAINGILSIKHLSEWGKLHNLDANRVHDAIPRFRDAVVAGGYLYADYAAAFRVWHKDKHDELRKQSTKPVRML